MHEPPAELPDDAVLAALAEHWPDAGGAGAVDRVEHLAVGFGAHHWRASAGYRPALFVTYDRLGAGSGHHDAAGLEDTHAATADLAFRLDFVVAGLPSRHLTWTVPVADGALSVTPWVQGERPGDDAAADPLHRADVLALLRRLHAVAPPARLRRWEPLDVASLDLAGPWTAGPLGEEARTLLLAHADAVDAWGARHASLLPVAQAAPWVVTHGEPHERNQLRTPVRTLLVDWESARLAPRERDLLALAGAGGPDGDLDGDLDGADPDLLELFDLEWRLDEVAQFSAWFRGPHPGSADDREALAGLRHELERPPVGSPG